MEFCTALGGLGYVFTGGSSVATVIFFSPGLDSLLAIFSKGFLLSTSIGGPVFFYYFLASLADPNPEGFSFLASLYLSRLDLFEL